MVDKPRRKTRETVFSPSLVRRMVGYDRQRRAHAARLHAARRARIASFLRRTKQFADAMRRDAAAEQLAASMEPREARCTCGWPKGPHATLCGLYIDEDADPRAAVAPADPVAELERDLTLLDVAPRK